MNNFKISILFLFGVLAVLTTILVISNSKEMQESVVINIKIDEKIKDNVEIYINPNGYELIEYTPKKYIGFTEIIYPLYINSEVQENHLQDIAKYSDYNIYAKYNNKFSIIRITNTLVLGNDKTTIEFSMLLDIENRPYITVIDKLPTYKSIPNNEINHHSYFYSKSDFNKIEEKSKNIKNTLVNINRLWLNFCNWITQPPSGGFFIITGLSIKIINIENLKW